MKRLVLSAVALSMLALPVAQAQAGPRHEQPRYEQQWKKPGYDQKRKHGYDKRQSMKRHHWQRGHRVPDWQRRHVVKDYHRYGLRRPGHGQQWVRVDNDFLLISIASGIIGGFIASQY
ncbi:MAG: RcnB family protein [Rhizobiaceae bacterium]|nr:RcnB family protein [Rhizobiaceae bacterium]